MEKSKSRKLDDWEETYYGRLIAETNPNRLQPHHKEIFDGIRDWWNTCLKMKKGICLTEKQLSAIKRSHYTAQRVQSKIDRPSHFDVNERLDVWANPAKPKS